MKHQHPDYKSKQKMQMLFIVIQIKYFQNYLCQLLFSFLVNSFSMMSVNDSTREKMLAPKKSPSHPPMSATKLSNG